MGSNFQYTYSTRRGKILLINAVNEVTRKNAQSWLEDGHIKKIADAYENYGEIDGFASVITIVDSEKNAFSLSIPLYVREIVSEEAIDSRTFGECLDAWQERRFDMKIAFEDMLGLLTKAGE